MDQYLFYVFGVIAVGASLAVIGQRNPMHSVLWLIASFVGLSGLYVLLDAIEWRDKFIEISKTTLSEMDVPLIRLEKEAIGVMNFESRRVNAFNEDDQGFMETLAGQAVIAIRNAMEYERTQRIAKEREALIAIVNTLLSHTDQKEIFSIILNKALEVTETDKGTINTCDDVRREIRVVVDKRLKPEFKNGVQTFDQGVIGRAVGEARHTDRPAVCRSDAGGVLRRI